MTAHRVKCWGFVLLFAGFALVAYGIWLLIAPSRYEGVTTINLMQVVPNFAGLERADDPIKRESMIQEELHIIVSDSVLTNVVIKMKLDIAWGQRYANGQKLEVADAVARVRRCLKLKHIANTSLIDVSFISEEPAEAAIVANAIAQAYSDYQLERYQRLQPPGLLVLQRQWIEQEEIIWRLQTNIDQLTQEINSPTLNPEDKAKKNLEFNESTNALEEAKRSTKTLEMKILSLPTDVSLSTTFTISVVEPAQTPTVPSNANRRVGKDLILAGVLVIFFGVRLLWRAYFAAPDPAA